MCLQTLVSLATAPATLNIEVLIFSIRHFHCSNSLSLQIASTAIASRTCVVPCFSCFVYELLRLLSCWGLLRMFSSFALSSDADRWQRPACHGDGICLVILVEICSKCSKEACQTLQMSFSICFRRSETTKQLPLFVERFTEYHAGRDKCNDSMLAAGLALAFDVRSLWNYRKSCYMLFLGRD